MQVVINISSLISNLEIKIDTNKRIFFKDGETVDYPIDRFVFRLLSIVSSWPKKLENNGVIDGEKYSIKIKENKTKREYIGVNSFPSNYPKFLELIHEVQDERN